VKIIRVNLSNYFQMQPNAIVPTSQTRESMREQRSLVLFLRYLPLVSLLGQTSIKNGRV